MWSNSYSLPCMGTEMNLKRPQWWRDWKANEWIYECFTCMHYKTYAPTKKKLMYSVKLHAKDCLNGWA